MYQLNSIGPAAAMVDVAATAAANMTAAPYSAFYVTESGIYTLFLLDGSEATLPLSAYQIYPCYMRGMKAGTVPAGAKFIGFKIY